MNKKQAAEFLRVSTRAIERYAAKGKITVTYTKNATGQALAEFNDADLQRVKEEMGQPPLPTRPTVEKKAIDTHDISDNHDNGNGRSSLALVPKNLIDFAELLSIGVGKQLLTLQSQALPISDKLTLSLSEASQLSGLSRGFLIVAIKVKKLKAAKRGRGWNIKRIDLDSYIKKL
jgi:excisionase family DNA binding protein